MLIKYITELTALEYSTESTPETGTDYLIKADIGDDVDFVYVRVHVSPPRSETEVNPVLTDVLFKPDEMSLY
jgi:hypothetical protein